mmetsp:Transcript_86826/g.177307  ORF Transcript_86826/g.177307 Transcript_86826/m.177307 type:complete len:133 (-) Transcript_86826:160-558(-)
MPARGESSLLLLPDAVDTSTEVSNSKKGCLSRSRAQSSLRLLNAALYNVVVLCSYLNLPYSLRKQARKTALIMCLPVTSSVPTTWTCVQVKGQELPRSAALDVLLGFHDILLMIGCCMIMPQPPALSACGLI